MIKLNLFIYFLSLAGQSEQMSDIVESHIHAIASHYYG